MNEHWECKPVLRGFSSVEDIYELLNKDGEPRGYIGGSYAAFMAAPVDTPILPNDVDVFAASSEHAYNIYYALTRTCHMIRETSVAITIQRDRGDLQIQIVKPHPEWKTFPDDVMSSFDLDVCRAMLIAPNSVLADKNVGQREAKILRISNPLRSLKRAIKYAARGVNIPDRELIKIFQAWDEASPERKAEILLQTRIGDPEEIALDVQTDGWYDEDDYFDGE